MKIAAAARFYARWDNNSKCVFEKIKKVREMLNDYPEANILLAGEQQIGDHRIARAIMLTLREFNEMPPVRTMYSACNIPNEMLLLNGAIAKLLRTLAVTDVRNLYPIQTGDVSINPDKSQQWLQLSNMYDQEYKILAERIKRSLNVSRAYGQWWSW